MDCVCVDCYPLDFGCPFDLREGNFITAAIANTYRLEHHGKRIIEGWAAVANGSEILIKMQFNVFDVKSLSADFE